MSYQRVVVVNEGGSINTPVRVGIDGGIDLSPIVDENKRTNALLIQQNALLETYNNELEGSFATLGLKLDNLNSSIGLANVKLDEAYAQNTQILEGLNESNLKLSEINVNQQALGGAIHLLRNESVTWFTKISDVRLLAIKDTCDLILSKLENGLSFDLTPILEPISGIQSSLSSHGATLNRMSQLLNLCVDDLSKLNDSEAIKLMNDLAKEVDGLNPSTFVGWEQYSGAAPQEVNLTNGNRIVGRDQLLRAFLLGGIVMSYTACVKPGDPDNRFHVSSTAFNIESTGICRTASPFNDVH